MENKVEQKNSGKNINLNHKNQKATDTFANKKGGQSNNKNVIQKSIQVNKGNNIKRNSIDDVPIRKQIPREEKRDTTGDTKIFKAITKEDIEREKKLNAIKKENSSDNNVIKFESAKVNQQKNNMNIQNARISVKSNNFVQSNIINKSDLNNKKNDFQQDNKLKSEKNVAIQHDKAHKNEEKKAMIQQDYNKKMEKQESKKYNDYENNKKEKSKVLLIMLLVIIIMLLLTVIFSTVFGLININKRRSN